MLVAKVQSQCFIYYGSKIGLSLLSIPTVLQQHTQCNPTSGSGEGGMNADPYPYLVKGEAVSERPSAQVKQFNGFLSVKFQYSPVERLTKFCLQVTCTSMYTISGPLIPILIV